MTRNIAQASALVFIGQALVAFHHLKKTLASHIVAHALEFEAIDLGDSDLGQAKDDVPFFEMAPEGFGFFALGNVGMHMKFGDHAADGQNFDSLGSIDRIKLPGRKPIGVRARSPRAGDAADAR